MKTILENLTNTNGEITTKVVNTNVNINPYLQLEITKGNITQQVNVWGTVYLTKMEGFFDIDVDDWEIDGAMLGNIKVDSLNQLHEALTKAGLKTLADSLELSKEDIKQAYIKGVLNTKEVQVVFEGKKCFQLLSEKEQIVERLKITKAETIKDVYFFKGNVLLADLLALDTVTQEDINAKIKELSE